MTCETNKKKKKYLSLAVYFLDKSRENAGYKIKLVITFPLCLSLLIYAHIYSRFDNTSQTCGRALS